MDVIRRVVVRGGVQGVGFRAFVEHEALRRKLAGWVRNCRDGAVETVFSGPEKTVEEMIAVCRRGPPVSRVDSVDVTDAAADQLDQIPAFTVRPTV